jgi:phosphoketolase
MDGPKYVNGLKVEGNFRAHQVPITDPATNPEHLQQLEDWLKSYKPEELFDENGRLMLNSLSWLQKVKGEWEPIRTPMEAYCCTIFVCPIFVIAT